MRLLICFCRKLSAFSIKRLPPTDFAQFYFGDDRVLLLSWTIFDVRQLFGTQFVSVQFAFAATTLLSTFTNWLLHFQVAFAVTNLLLPFLIYFCRNKVAFAISNLLLPWCYLLFRRYYFIFAFVVTVVGHRTHEFILAWNKSGITRDNFIPAIEQG